MYDEKYEDNFDDRDSSAREPQPAISVMDLVFLGFNSRVIALHRQTGEVAWMWKCPKGRHSYVAVLLDGDIIIASVNGYTYGLDPLSGAQIWQNVLKGTGHGVPAVVSLRGNSGSAGAAAIIAQMQQQAQAAG